MKTIGYLLLAVGFLVGAFAAALDVQNVNWALYLGGAAAGIVGLVLFKRQASAIERSGEVLELNRSELRDSIQSIVSDLEELNSDSKLQGGPLRERIDLKLREELRRFADARHSMVYLFGLQTYADIMSNFAAGERYINRVWSASADGYDGEAETYLKKAAVQFHEARQQLTNAINLAG